jgi:hypothetical protein
MVMYIVSTYPRYGTLAALHMVQSAELRKRAKETGLTVLLRPCAAESRMPFPMPQPSQVHGPIAPQRRQRHLGRGCRPCLDGTGLVAVSGDQLVAVVNLGVAFERHSQGSDLPNQVRWRRSVWRVEGYADCLPDGRPAFLDEIGEEAYAVGISSRDQKA